MLDVNKAISDNRFTVMNIHTELHTLARNFAATGNDRVASQLRAIAHTLTESQSSLDNAWHNELSRLVQADQKALRDTLLAAIGVRA